MNPYKSIGSTIGTQTALDLAQRLSAWHDAMVVHQRRSGAARSGDCDGECPHSEAPLLWLDALEVYGDRAHELAFLRGHADAMNRDGDVAGVEASL